MVLRVISRKVGLISGWSLAAATILFAPPRCATRPCWRVSLCTGIPVRGLRQGIILCFSPQPRTYATVGQLTYGSCTTHLPFPYLPPLSTPPPPHSPSFLSISLSIMYFPLYMYFPLNMYFPLHILFPLSSVRSLANSRLYRSAV